MDTGIIFHQVVSLVGAFSVWLILALFLMTLLGEFGISIPYLHETIWLLAGYHISGGSLAPGPILLFCLTSFAGRELGALLLYKISGLGSGPFTKFYLKLTVLKSSWRHSASWWKRYLLAPPVGLATRFLTLNMKNKAEYDRDGKLIAPRINISPFHVALGRFIWLKIPLTITMGLTRQLFALIFGVALFSLAWDALYILLGFFSAGKGLSPYLMLAITFGGFICINTSMYLVRRFIVSQRNARVAVD